MDAAAKAAQQRLGRKVRLRRQRLRRNPKLRSPPRPRGPRRRQRPNPQGQPTSSMRLRRRQFRTLNWTKMRRSLRRLEKRTRSRTRSTRQPDLIPRPFVPQIPALGGHRIAG
jgi:hypothetical protein